MTNSQYNFLIDTYAKKSSPSTQPLNSLDKCFKDFVELTKDILNPEVSGIALLNRDKVFNTKVSGELNLPDEIIPEESICARAIITDQDFVEIESISEHEDFNAATVFQENPHLDYYAAVKLQSSIGKNLGMLYIMRAKPMELKPKEKKVLKNIADRIVERIEIEARNAMSQRTHLLSASKLQMITEKSPATILLTDENHMVTFINRTRTIKERESILGHSIESLIHADDVDKFHEKFNHAKEKEETQKIVVQYLTSRKKYRWARCKISAFRDNRNGSLNYLILASDVTKETLSRQEKEKYYQRMLQAQAAAKIGSWDYDVETGNLDYSPQLKEVIHASGKELQQMDENTWLNLVDPRDREAVSAQLARNMQKSGSFEVIYRLAKDRLPKDCDIDEKWVHLRGSVILNDQGKPKNIYGTVQDISNHVYSQKALEKSNKKAQEELYSSKKSRYQLLSAQLNPHFIYNALNSIQYNILDNDAESAIQFLSDFASLMRTTLNNSKDFLIPIEDEIEFLDQYLSLEQKRLDKEFDYEITLGDKIDEFEFHLPPMLLQPIVENSIIHGIGPKKEGSGRIRICFRVKNDRLFCTIEDNGVGRNVSESDASSQKGHESMATKITDKRLDILNSLDIGEFDVRIVDIYNDSGDPSGTRVDILLPTLEDATIR